MLERWGEVNQEGRGSQERVPNLGNSKHKSPEARESTDKVQFYCRTIWGGDVAERRGWRDRLCKIP